MEKLSPKLDWSLANPKWAGVLNPLLLNALINGQQIDNIHLTAATPLVIYHSLGQAPAGWFVVDNTVAATFIRTQPFNPKSITLQASATTVISLWVY